MPPGHRAVGATRRRTGALPPAGPGVQRSAAGRRGSWRLRRPPGAPGRSRRRVSPGARGLLVSRLLPLAVVAGLGRPPCVSRFNSGAGQQGPAPPPPLRPPPRSRSPAEPRAARPPGRLGGALGGEWGRGVAAPFPPAGRARGRPGSGVCPGLEHKLGARRGRGAAGAGAGGQRADSVSAAPPRAWGRVAGFGARGGGARVEGERGAPAGGSGKARPRPGRAALRCPRALSSARGELRDSPCDVAP